MNAQEVGGVNDLDALRGTTTDGTLPEYVWPGGYPTIFFTEGGLLLCAKCANEDDTSDPVTAFDVYYEGAFEICDDGGERIYPAYGNPDAGAAMCDYCEIERPEHLDDCPMRPEAYAK